MKSQIAQFPKLNTVTVSPFALGQTPLRALNEGVNGGCDCDGDCGQGDCDCGGNDCDSN